MPSREAYTNALNEYRGAINDAAASLQQGRALHMHDLVNIYVNTLHTGDTKAVAAMEAVIGQRSIFNERKLVFDAADLTVHDVKVQHAVGKNAVKGGHYGARRSNALLHVMHKKIVDDRDHHIKELQGLTAGVLAGGGCGCGDAAAQRKVDNAGRGEHDDQRMAATQANVKRLLGGGANAADVLRGGGGGGGGVRATCDDENQVFRSREAAELWTEITPRMFNLTACNSSLKSYGKMRFKFDE
jgi:hypothetical protein